MPARSRQMANWVTYCRMKQSRSAISAMGDRRKTDSLRKTSPDGKGYEYRVSDVKDDGSSVAFAQGREEQRSHGVGEEKYRYQKSTKGAICNPEIPHDEMNRRSENSAWLFGFRLLATSMPDPHVVEGDVLANGDRKQNPATKAVARIFFLVGHVYLWLLAIATALG